MAGGGIGFRKGAEEAHTRQKSKDCMRRLDNLEAPKAVVWKKLMSELERLKQRVGLGYEVDVRWLPGAVKFRNGRRLAEEVVGDTILIYAEDGDEAVELVRHGFAEWLLNRHTKRYRMLVNKLIELFEEIQYGEKERLVDALARLLSQP